MNARTWLQMGEATIGALETITKLAHIGGDKAPAALAAIKAALHNLEDGFAGKVSPQAVLSQIEALHHMVETNDAEALAELHKRFASEP